ncbi:MAG: bifunctional methylenetetrahydrofolate dehydrogenase/methenyltetrahydrofolate cyclohydrolase, partial [Chloroflexi bacterium]|nr:bifunctional methylenetetrahydrofolate dehydrogenase/methenyltetrahydrofolate cyclohydrolase [Chloroflexota bacterium]
MMGQIIDGKSIAEQVRAGVAQAVEKRVQSGKIRPGLATVLVGDDPASHVYVRSKIKACEEVGIESIGHQLPATAAQQDVEDLVKSLNEDPRV